MFIVMIIIVVDSFVVVGVVVSVVAGRGFDMSKYII